MAYTIRIHWAAWILVVLAWLGPAVSSVEAQLVKPNIVWIIAEDMNTDLGTYGDRYAVTPNLDRLARSGVRYTHFYATAPVCSPSRSTLLTGLYATSTGTEDLRSFFPLPATIKGHPTYLRESGYYCSMSGKADYNTSSANAIIAAGWDEHNDQAHWRNRKPGQPFYSVFNLGATHQSYASSLPYEKFEKDVGGTLKPHERHDPAKAPMPPYYPDTFAVRRTIARYYDCVTYIDKEVGRILAELESDGLTEDTIVIFFADNGVGIPRGKRLLHDTGMHEPLLIRFPRKFQHLAPAAPGMKVDRLVSFVDVAPTMLNLAGLPVPSYMQGRPFLGPGSTLSNDYIYGARDRVDEAFDLSRSVRDRRYLYIRNYMPHLSWNQPEGYSDTSEMRRDITRLAAEGKLNAAQLTYAGPRRAIEELYDTETDPFQVKNLAAMPEHQTLLGKMRALHRQWIMDTRDVGFLPEPEVWKYLNSDTPYEMAKDDTRYPLARILDAADLVGRPESVTRQIELLSDSDAGVRFWAALGLNAAGADAMPARAALLKTLQDGSASVRIEAAAALANLGEVTAALNVLSAEVMGRNLDLVAHAARALQMMGEKARPALPTMEKVLTNTRKLTISPDFYAYCIIYSLDTSIKKLTL